MRGEVAREEEGYREWMQASTSVRAFFFILKRLPERDGDVFLLCVCVWGGIQTVGGRQTRPGHGASDSCTKAATWANTRTGEVAPFYRNRAVAVIGRGCYGNRGNGCLMAAAMPSEHQTRLRSRAA